MFHFEWPWILLLLPLPWIVRRFIPAAPLSIGGTLFAPFVNTVGEHAESQHHLAGHNPVIRWGALLCWVLLLLAASRPQWLGDAVALPETGRNLLLAVDVSGSMEIADLDENNLTRLDVVKQVAGEFIQRREGDRIGLILFGSQAYLQAPITFDRTAISTLLKETVIGIAGRETAIGDAIGLALKRLRGSEGDTVMILLTDGANTAGNVNPKKSAELAAQQGLRIHTIGVGGEAKSVMGAFGMQTYNPAADLDEETLESIADVTGGYYFRATDRDSLEQIYHQLDELEPITTGNQIARPVTALYPWPLGLGFLLSQVLAIVAWRSGFGS